MRMVIMLAAVLLLSLLIFKGYPFGSSADSKATAGTSQHAPISRAREVDPLVERAAEAQRKALEQQQ